MKIEDLAMMVQRGFQGTAKKEDITEVKTELQKVNQRLDVVDQRLSVVDQRLVNLEYDMSYLKARVSEIGNLEIENLKERVVVLEKKVSVSQ